MEIIDLILSRKNGASYFAKYFYDVLIEHETDKTIYPIARAFSSGDEEYAKEALCEYTKELKCDLSKYINSKNWLGSLKRKREKDSIYFDDSNYNYDDYRICKAEYDDEETMPNGSHEYYDWLHDDSGLEDDWGYLMENIYDSKWNESKWSVTMNDNDLFRMDFDNLAHAIEAIDNICTCHHTHIEQYGETIEMTLIFTGDTAVFELNRIK